MKRLESNWVGHLMLSSGTSCGHQYRRPVYVNIVLNESPTRFLLSNNNIITFFEMSFVYKKRSCSILKNIFNNIIETFVFFF